MFTWLKRLFRKRSGWGDVYLPEDRLIYRFFDGKTTVMADPLPIYRRMMDVQPELSADSKIATSTLLDDKAVGKAHESLVEHIRGIFGVKEFGPDGGLTELETIGLWDHFLTWCGDVKKNSNPPPTSAAASSPASSPSPAAPPPMPNSSGSGSAATGPSTASPGPSPSASG